MVYCRIVHILDHFLELPGGCSIVTALLHHNGVVGVILQPLHLSLHIHCITGGEEGCEVWSGFLEGVQHQCSPPRHLTLLQQNLQVRTMKMARRNVGILNVKGFLVTNSHGLLDPSVFTLTESKQAIEGPRSVMVMYWLPLSASWAFWR